MTTTRLSIGLFLIGFVALRGAAQTTNLVVATWNVENLFDSFDDPTNSGDDEYTPQGKMYWSYPRYRQKLTNLAEVVAAMRPDILCLQEVENRLVLEDLSQVTAAAFGWSLPVVIHREGEDMRGIDVAILARHEPVHVAWMQVSVGRRDQLAATFVVDGRELTVFCNHWKSWWGDAEASGKARTQEARHLAKQVRRRLKEVPSAAILAAGDFNDQVDSDILTKEAGFALWPLSETVAAHQALLYNLSGVVPPEARGTYYYSKNRVWNSFDSMSVSPGMLPGADSPASWQVATNTYNRFISTIQTNAAGRPLSYWRALRTPKGSRWKVGISDHFPVRVELVPAGSSGLTPPETLSPPATEPSWSTRWWQSFRRLLGAER